MYMAICFFKDKENSKTDCIQLLTITVQKNYVISEDNLNVFLAKFITQIMAYLKEIDLLSLTDYKLFIIFPDKKKEKERLDFIDFYQQWPSFFWNHCDTI